MSDCSICYDPLAPNQRQKKLGCGHAYHPVCINEWFATSNQGACPTCRVVEPGFVRPQPQQRHEGQPYRLTLCYNVCFYLAAFVCFLFDIIFQLGIMLILLAAVLNPVGILYLLYLAVWTFF